MSTFDERQARLREAVQADEAKLLAHMRRKRGARRDNRDFILLLADRIYRAHEILARRAEKREKRAVVLTETDYCPLV